ncbi:hypothetical protein LTR17_006467 [Elasticomyces elasticus]|nr:hypothetical protein LTR17_006467 [Elasticomyces elasticus]
MDSEATDDLPMRRALQAAVGEVTLKEMDTEKTQCSPMSEGPQTVTKETNNMFEAQNEPETPGLLTIAAELRNTIYELAFTSDGTEPVHLFTANPRNKAITLVCRQTNNEAKQMYVKAYREYWAHSTFYVDYDMTDKPEHDKLTLEDLANVRHLRLIMQSARIVEIAGSLVSEMVEGRSTVAFARRTDGKWWPITERGSGKGGVLCWSAWGSCRRIFYLRPIYNKSALTSSVSMLELSTVMGRAVRLKSAQSN